jgi:hypothetical protein
MFDKCFRWGFFTVLLHDICIGGLTFIEPSFAANEHIPIRENFLDLTLKPINGELVPTTQLSPCTWRVNGGIDAEKFKFWHASELSKELADRKTFVKEQALAFGVRDCHMRSGDTDDAVRTYEVNLPLLCDMVVGRGWTFSYGGIGIDPLDHNWLSKECAGRIRKFSSCIQSLFHEQFKTPKQPLQVALRSEHNPL